MTEPIVRKGDLFASSSQTLVNTVNCVGVMGKGLALAFKQRFPEMCDDYIERCNAKEVQLGRPYLFKGLVPPWVLNFPTKEHWRAASRLDAIEEGLDWIVRNYREWGVTSLAVPPLGCGLGQLDWRVVGPTLFRGLSRLDIPVELFAPAEAPAAELTAAFLSGSATPTSTGLGLTGRIEPAWVALVEIVKRALAEPYHHEIGRTSFQKIAYFATCAGIPTGFQFSRGSYGPFSDTLKPAITRMINNGLLVETQLGRMFAVRPGPTFDDASRTFSARLMPWQAAIDRVADLFLRVSTQQSETAATVHFAATNLCPPIPSESEVFDAVMAWKVRRDPPLQPELVGEFVRNLGILGWIRVTPSLELPLPKDELSAL